MSAVGGSTSYSRPLSPNLTEYDEEEVSDRLKELAEMADEQTPLPISSSSLRPRSRNPSLSIRSLPLEDQIRICIDLAMKDYCGWNRQGPIEYTIRPPGYNGAIACCITIERGKIIKRIDILSLEQRAALLKAEIGDLLCDEDF